MKFAVLALLGLVTVTQANQLPLEDAVSLYENVDEDLTEMIRITINKKNIENIAKAGQPLSDSGAKVAMKCGEEAQKDLMKVMQTKEMADLVKFVQQLDPATNREVRKDLLEIDEQMLQVAAQGIKSYRRGKESSDFDKMEEYFSKGNDVWMQHQNEDFAALDRELGDVINVKLALLKKPWGMMLNYRINRVFSTTAYKNFEGYQIKCMGKSAEAKALRADWKKFMAAVGQNIKLTDVPKDILNYNMAKTLNRFMKVTDELLHGRYSAAYKKNISAMKVYTSHKDDDDSDDE